MDWWLHVFAVRSAMYVAWTPEIEPSSPWVHIHGLRLHNVHFTLPVQAAADLLAGQACGTGVSAGLGPCSEMKSMQLPGRLDTSHTTTVALGSTRPCAKKRADLGRPY